MKLITLIIILCLLTLPLRAEEAQTLNIEYRTEKQFDIKGVTKYFIVNPNIATVEIRNGTLFMKGRRVGSTMLYLWQKDKFHAYIVKGIKSNAIKVKGSHESRVTKKADSPNGRYSINNIAGFSNQIYKQDKAVYQNFSLNVPFSDKEGLNFRTGLITRFSPNYTELTNVTLPVISLGYYSPYYTLDVGDLNSFNGTLKGIKFSAKNKKYNYNVFSGIQQQQLVLFDKARQRITNLADKTFVTGASGQMATPVKNLYVNGALVSRFNFGENTENQINLNAGFNWNPTSNFAFRGNVGTNFYGLTFTASSKYRYSWEKTNEFIDLTGTYRNLSRHFIRIGSEPVDYFNFRLSSHHVSGFNLFGNYTINFLNGTALNRSYGFKVSREIPKSETNLFGEIRSLENFNSIRNIFSFGLNSADYFPLALRYNYIQNIVPTRISGINQLRVNLKLLKYYSMNIYLFGDASLSDNIKSQQLQLSGGLSFYIPFSKNYNASLNFNYISLFPDLGTKEHSDNFRVGLNNTWKINHFHSLAFNASYNTGFANNFEDQGLNTNIRYTYSFGMDVEEFFGDVRGIVFDDANENGSYDKGEKLIPGVKVTIEGKDAFTNNEGYYNLSDIDYGNQQVLVDDAQLPDGYKVTGPSPVLINFNEKVKEVNFALSKKTMIRGIVYSNPGLSSGLENVEILLDGTISFRTTSGGGYSFNVVPGKHIIRINPLTIPKGYTLLDKLSKEVEVGKEDQEINFIFKPVISLKGSVFYKTNNKPAANVTLTIEITNQKGIKEEKVITDNQGNFLLTDIENGIIDISSPLLKEPVEIEVPDKPGDMNVKVPLGD
jgi:hypothetical protein